MHETIAGFRAALDHERAAGRSVGVVPTMGYLHEGHASLMRTASADNDVAALTIFVNPLQFADGEDLETYPRDLEGDLALAAASGVAHLFTPSLAEMYPRPVLTKVAVAALSRRFEGASRPEHFAGVATVVTKLFAISGAARAYFGEKDFQQLAVVRRLVADLSLPIEVVGCPIVRDPDGLALSSRNVYLTAAQRAAAPALHRGLQAARRAVEEGGERNADVVRAVLADAVAGEPEAVLDYAELVDAETLEPTQHVRGDQRLLVAAAFGVTRLLDNMAISTDA
ncbi:MAG: pantoate--beta-alanine ligase [Acidimicrobiales bacterium]